LTRKLHNSALVFRWLCKKPEVPARKTKTGAQKCVIHRVSRQRPLMKKIPCMVQRHDDHHQAPQKINAVDAVRGLL
jgi:hypothetical protein